MEKTLKEWCVRTKTGEVLGPYSERELIEELQKRAFSIHDEISKSCTYWISAQTLSTHEADEFTRTSTRTGTLSNLESTLTPTPTVTPSADDLTPTPEMRRSQWEDPEQDSPPLKRATSRRTWAPIITFVVILSAIAVLVWKSKPLPPANVASSTQDFTTHESESPLVQEAYKLIELGENGEAARLLTAHHEKRPKEIDYLIPYAISLILEGESTQRAKKFLDSVLASPQATPNMKIRAHNWLGYLALSTNDGDMGESHFLEALQLNPKDAAARFNLGRAYLKQEKFSQGLDYLQLAELEKPDLWLVHLYKGRAKVSLGNMEEARQAFKTALANAPDRWLIYIYYALFQVGVREHEEARTTLRKMLSRDPGYEQNSPAPLGYFQEKVNYQEYLSAFNHILDKSPGELRDVGRMYINHLFHGSTGVEAKRVEAMAEGGGVLSKVIALKLALDRELKGEELIRTVDRLPSSLNEFGSFAYVLRGDANFRLERLTQAERDFQYALSMEPKSAIANWSYLNFLRQTGKKEDAQKIMNQLHAYHPNYVPAILSGKNF